MTICVWDVLTGKHLLKLVGHTRSVTALAVLPPESPSGNVKLASGSGDTTVRVWDVKTGTCIRTLANFVEPVVSLAVIPPKWPFGPAMLASTCCTGALRVCDVVSGACFHTMRDHNFNGPLAVLPNGNLVSCLDLLLDGADDVYGVLVWE
jgi:WD40 repeat protein